MSSSLEARVKLSPQVNRIVTVIAERIESDVYEEGEWLPAERTLADEFGVSRILIRAAVRELDQRRLLDCSANRRPMVRRRQVAPGRSDTPVSVVDNARLIANRSIAVWMWPQRDATGSATMIQGIQEALDIDFRLVLGSATGTVWEQVYASEARFLRQVLAASDVEGVIIGYLGGVKNLGLLRELRAANIPIVFVDHFPPTGFDGDYVGITNRRSAESAVKHLLALGHKAIAHISNYDDISTVVERGEGYRRALKSAGIPFRAGFVIRDPGPVGSDQQNGLEEPLRDLVQSADAPTAIFAVNDITAYRVIAALTVIGVRVPDDVSIVGFDGIERWLPTPPFLTTIAQPFEEIGRQAVELLMDRIESPGGNQYRHVLLDAPLDSHLSATPPPVGERLPRPRSLDNDMIPK